MKALRLRETCIQYTTTRNRYGDLKLTKVGTLLCLFRNISSLSELNHREDVTISGIFWFASTSGIKKGDVIGFNSQLYRMESANIANARLTTNATHFIKCNASLLRQIS